MIAMVRITVRSISYLVSVPCKAEDSDDAVHGKALGKAMAKGYIFPGDHTVCKIVTRDEVAEEETQPRLLTPDQISDAETSVAVDEGTDIMREAAERDVSLAEAVTGEADPEDANDYPDESESDWDDPE
jgi:hypothetical protein